MRQYVNRGESLYLTHCANCHQKDGSGLGQLYPPISGSDYLADKNSVVCLIKYGKSGEMIVNGKTFNQEMPPMPSLTNIEIAEITTYIYNAWTIQDGLTDVKEVSTILNSCK